MLTKYSCIVRLKENNQRWNFDGNVERCIQTLTELGFQWDTIFLINEKSKEVLAVLFPFDDSLFA
jgi:hypothetical protein